MVSAVQQKGSPLRRALEVRTTTALTRTPKIVRPRPNDVKAVRGGFELTEQTRQTGCLAGQDKCLS